MTSPSTPHPPVVVLLGGPSAEHDVSIVSGTAIASALRADGLNVREIVIDLDGRWWWLPADHERGAHPPAAYDDPAALGAEGPITVGAAIDRLAAAEPPPIAFIALHGPFGEDGTVQALLDAVGVAYTGSGVLGSAIGMDKSMQKRIWRGLGLPVVDWREIRVARWRADPAAVLGELEAFAAGTPRAEGRLMVKPARLGSSVGMTPAHGPLERAEALDLAFRYDTLAVVEIYLAGARDLEISVIGSDPPLGIYGPGEIVAGREFYDYAAKYTLGLSATSTRASVSDALRTTLQKLARDAYRSVGAEGFARVDFLVRDDEPYLSEINTIPGFTPISLFPTMPAEGGLDFTAVCRRALDLGLQRHAERAATRLTPADLPR
ncbi:MAG: D-alanine--D-alanine ligase [Chloroflexi bacterium]|nr:D-alanine--D-alanine ligase [Chloroflexota bacterium]